MTKYRKIIANNIVGCEQLIDTHRQNREIERILETEKIQKREKLSDIEQNNVFV